MLCELLQKTFDAGMMVTSTGQVFIFADNLTQSYGDLIAKTE